MNLPVRTAQLVAVVAVSALSLSACGDKAHSTAASSPSGSGVQANGTPVRIGFINDEQGAVATPETMTGAKAAAAYVNSHGGVNGQRVELVPCATNGSPESAVSCANTMITQKVVVVALGTEIAADSLVKPLEEAGIGIFSVAGQGNAAQNDPAVTYTSAPQALTFAGVWKFFKQVKTLKPLLVAPDLGPATKQIAEKALLPSAKAAGVDLSYILYNPAAPDFAAAVTAAKNKGNDGLYVLGSEGDCATFIRTAKQLGWHKVLFGGTCTQYAHTLGSQAADVYTLSWLVPAGAKATAPPAKQEQVQLYIDQMKASGAQADTGSSYAAFGFSDVITLSDALKAAPADPTVATAQAAVTKYKGDVFLGVPVDCSARPVPGGSCGTGFYALKTNGDGSQTVLDGTYLDATKP